MTTSVYGPYPVIVSPATQQTGNINLSGEIRGIDFKAGGLTGASGVSRYVGATASGSPLTGTFAIGDFIIDRTGTIYICTTAGTPGTWTQIAGGSSTSLTATSTQLTSDHALTGSTFEDIISISLVAGTWVCWAHAVVIHQGISDATIQIYDGTTVQAANSQTNASTFASAIACVSPAFVLAATTTVKLRVANANGGSVHAVGQNSSTGNNATTLTALKVA